MSKAMMKKTLLLSSSTLVSRVFGLIRELLLPRFLGVGIVADAFVTALRIPNSLRKIFAEGALSAACIPTIVRVIKEQDRTRASQLITTIFLIVEGCILLLCAFIALHATTVIQLMAPGWSTEQVAVAAPLLKIFIFFIFFISSSALLAAALQAVHHYIAPIFAQIMMNVVVIIGAILCLRYQLSVTTLAWSFVIGGFVMLLIHIFAYYRHNFSFLVRGGIVSKQEVKEILKKFGPSLLSVGIIEINLFISTQFASYLPSGSIALYTYASNFMRLPMGILIIPFANILFTHFSRVSTYAPRRLSYYLLEATKVIFWVMTPVVLFMSIFSYEIFATMYLSEKFPVHDVITAQWLLIAMLSSLFFFSVNKILLNIFYAMHETFVPSMITLAGAVSNTVLDIVLMRAMGIYGLALATSIAALLQTLLFLFFLRREFSFALYFHRFWSFALRVLAQLFLAFSCFMLLVGMIRALLLCYLSPSWALFFTQKFGLWLWLGPLFGLICLGMFFTRKLFRLKMHFIDG